ncbi:DNA/RNA non-specific endonuclease [Flavobacterium sp. K5-23]|uniref:DNA/RNA non-specific endonuclease n=1 Tax=Flavobacterium sp. K5-23 TaxID=2746225 RepID=UPI00200DB83D|nr:DNA/RNA non-specific endonuclease [Flavobacterium sp. K5-23]UQD55916.1 DNA/RNA non-specific endonuclease [Flavobacterium sp. K5-23]
MKCSKIIVFSISFIGMVFISSCKKDSNSNEIFTSDSTSVSYSYPNEQVAHNITFDYLPTSTTNQIINHKYYTLSYSEKDEQPEWVGYELKANYIVNNNFKRPYFIDDPKVTTGSADWRNYKNSGYDKGHLCPAADMEFDKNAYNETFYTSNISPQDRGFNGGVWNRLEQKTRYWASMYDGVYVITGGVLKGSLKSIGKEKVTVPDYFYKILLDNSNGKYKMIAFLMPNKKSEKPLYSFVVSVDSIEKLTGIDFFPKLEDKLEDSLEKNVSYNLWLFN